MVGPEESVAASGDYNFPARPNSEDPLNNPSSTV